MSKFKYNQVNILAEHNREVASRLKRYTQYLTDQLRWLGKEKADFGGETEEAPAAAEVNFDTLAAIQNYTLPDESEESLYAFADGIMAFVYGDSSMEDKIEAVKTMAVLFGEDPSAVDAAYVQDLLSEEASVNICETAKAVYKEMAASWFGAKTLNEEQKLTKLKLGKVLKGHNKTIKNKINDLRKANIKIALSVIDKIGKASGFKTKVINKNATTSGAVSVEFSVGGVISMDDFTDAYVKLAKTSENYTLTVGA